ncbi:hypothetical protein AcV7_005098 [Taiwanofungus camphoratus]|nr:hypothetical protein AcV7_005098 [Antrodia cinnamomea]
MVFGVLPTALADKTVFTSSPRRVSSLVVAESVFKRFLVMHPWECVALQYQKRELSFPIGNVPTRFVNIHAILLYACTFLVWVFQPFVDPGGSLGQGHYV